MFNNNSGYSLADIAAATGNGRNNGGFGFGDGDGGIWMLVLFILIRLGGWNNNGFSGNGSGGNGAVAYVTSDVQRGFDQAELTTGISSIASSLCNGFSNVQQSLCNGFAGVNQGVANGFAQAEIANNARQMADMQQNFSIQSALQNCCCENRAAVADLKYTVATENCMDRTAAAQNTRDIIDAIRSGDQMLMDKICALELQGVKNQLDEARRDNISLQNQLNMATLRESQTAQNAFIAQGFTNEIDALYNRLNNCPVSTIPVYGKQPIFSCSNQNCGCGGNNFYN